MPLCKALRGDLRASCVEGVSRIEVGVARRDERDEMGGGGGNLEKR